MTQVDPTPPQAQQPAPITEQALWERVCKQASVLLDRPKEKPLRFGYFALGQLYVFWKGEPAADGSLPARGVTVYERGKPTPIKASLGIMAIFGYADDFVRVYCLPIDPNDKTVIGPARITLSRSAPVPSAFLEYMPVDQFVTEIASEVFNDLSGGGDDEDEDEEEEEEEEEEEGGEGFTPT
jgi:hypothetical protein